MLFILFVSIIVLQRVLELYIARKNEKWMKGQGGVEYGQEHYPIMVTMHIMFFVALLVEVLVLNKQLSSWWPVLLSLFFVTQAIRIWALSSLGKYWNTKIIVLPNTSIVKKGPYKYFRHPNYTIVALEILVIPMLFEAFWTAVIFTILNVLMLSVRIPLEEKALMSVTDYTEQFKEISRFPTPLKKS
ncbi:isoprenylcysteine carboxyl methyltransferase family protein [Bacillus suaedaesalsae]|uniref:15-methylpalmitoyl-4-hydroxy-2-pyrone 4-O-methyltransferase n=1 Tax=Bacillus suaedaesalsae TaxID=2810349 RepID=A0ABS2DLI1_9BACI|nr:isoprenylcysteine carboxylmethyltransferase family protein [Bacillus suaedaesalsae]MBM6619308.1 hypothetical protein [Bacillus suaedaesalsae]